MDNKELGLWSRRGLLAYVYTGVSVLLKCLSCRKVALIYYGSVALTFTVRQFPPFQPISDYTKFQLFLAQEIFVLTFPVFLTFSANLFQGLKI